MSSHASKPEISQQRQTDSISATAQEPSQEIKMEVKPAIPVFSYAQAAKSKAPSVPATPSIGMAKSDTNDLATKKGQESNSNPPPSESKNSAPKRATSEGATPRGNDFKASNDPPLSKPTAPEGAVKEQVSEIQTKPATSGNQNVSKSPSPDFGTTSISTLPKDDDGFSAVNGSSDSTWDKQSQTSQNGNKNEEKDNVEKDTVQKELDGAWDEAKPESASLKEAPPPPVNFWAQRMAQNPKVKPQQSAPPQSLKPVPATNGTAPAGESVKPNESSVEYKKQESKKRTKGNLDDRPTNKEGSKSVEGKGRSGEGKIDQHLFRRNVLMIVGSGKANAGTMAPPPPPGDAISWPTPDTALEEKKKPQSRTEKEDKEKTPTAKPHGKKEWQPVPFVPTVNFNTPMPTSRNRGGRGASGAGRENGGRGRNPNGVDKGTSTSASIAGQSSMTNDERGKAAPGSAGAALPTTQKSKRASSAGPAVLKEQRRPGDAFGGERRKDSEFNSIRTNQGKGAGGNEPRRQSASTSNDNQAGKGPSGRGPPREAFNAPKRAQTFDDGRNSQDAPSTAQTASRAGEAEKRGEGYNRAQDSTKDFQGGANPRERGEGRSERGGRGGYRGRGGPNFNSFNNHPANGPGFAGVPPQYQQQSMGGLSSRSFSNHERLASQPPPSYYPPNQPPNRPYRSNSRSHSINHSYGRFSHQSHGGPPHLSNLQTDLANNYGYSYEPQPGSMSAVAYNPYMPHISGMVAVQMEYYFSVDNLCKDTFLRKNMNSQGWVRLELVAGFNRIRQLTTDTAMVRDVCLNSSVIELRVAEDESFWLRKRVDWQQWVMDMDTRVPEARNDGPQFAAFQPFNPYGAPQPYPDGQEMSPRSASASVAMDSLQYHSLDGAAAPLQHVVMAPPQPQNGTNSGSQVPLSAAVSEFSPSVRSINGRTFSSPDPHAHGPSNISNEEMDKLNIAYKTKPADPSAPVPPPFHSASTRTLSNGSFDRNTTGGSELPKFTERPSRPLLNGENPDR